MTTFIPEDFYRPYNKDNFSNWKNLAKHNGLGDICEKLLSDPYVLFLVMAAMFLMDQKTHISSMQDTPRNIHTKFGSNWSSSFRGEEFCIIVNDDDVCQVITIAHMAFGQVS